jgi:halimadienyl-diphosphate synthase
VHARTHAIDICQEGNMIDLKRDARELLGELDQAAMSNTAYDTAWVARVREGNGSSAPAFPELLGWLRRNQHPNGSWGGKVSYYHDLIICTLAALVALAEHRDGPGDQEAIGRAERFICQHIGSLHRDPAETVGFELILPSLLERARQLGLALPYDKCGRYYQLREQKLGMIPEQLIYSREVTTAHSLEFMGEGLNVERAADLREENGSFGNSPSATAYFLVECADSEAGRRYLAQAVKAGGGAVMPAHPVEVFDKSWVLYNLQLAGFFDELREEVKERLDELYQCWDSRRGVGFSREYSVPDLDDTAVVFKLLHQAGYDVDPSVFASYERDAHFICYPFERNPSLGVNVHLLDALRVCPDFERQCEMVEKALGFCRERIRSGGWFDKWHISPFYVIAHVVVACIGQDNDLARVLVGCLARTQRQDGSWGYFGPTIEETAYCLQALILYHRSVELLERSLFYHAAQYLYSHYHTQDYPALWIEKSLYAPAHIVRSAVLSALWMYEAL